MIRNLGSLNKNLLSVLKQIGVAADRQSLTVYVVGGFVRDLILKRKNLDVDVVVEGDAVAFAQHLARQQKADVKVYKEFGTATLVYLSGLRVDFVTARREVYLCPGALPTVSPGTIRDDLFRRDFTINAMAMVINSSRFGELVDIFGGMNDLKKCVVRILHSKSFLDDPTRILRAIRFEQRFDFRLEPQTLSLLKSAIENGYVSRVTPQRYFEEFKKILKEAYPVKAIKRLQMLGGLNFMKSGRCPSFSALFLMERNIRKAERKTLYKDYKEWWLAYCMGLMENWSVSDRSAFVGPLNLTRGEKASLLESLRAVVVMKALSKKTLKPRQVYEFLVGLPLPTIYFIRVRTSVNIVGLHVDNFFKIYSKVVLNVTGEDLKRLGIPEGKVMGDVLRELLLRKIDGKISSPGKELKEVNQVKIMLQEKP